MEAELWEFPTLSEGAEFNVEEKTLNIGKRSLSTPVFITRDNHDVKNIHFFIPGAPDKEKFLDSGVVKQTDYLWVDSCDAINKYVSEGAPYSNELDLTQLCAVSKFDGTLKKHVLTESMTLLPPL